MPLARLPSPAGGGSASGASRGGVNRAKREHENSRRCAPLTPPRSPPLRCGERPSPSRGGWNTRRRFAPLCGCGRRRRGRLITFCCLQIVADSELRRRQCYLRAYPPTRTRVYPSSAFLDGRSRINPTSAEGEGRRAERAGVEIKYSKRREKGRRPRAQLYFRTAIRPPEVPAEADRDHDDFPRHGPSDASWTVIIHLGNGFCFGLVVAGTTNIDIGTESLAEAHD